jgi:hypothetical protein
VIRRTQSDAIDSGARDRDTRHAGIQARPETERSSLSNQTQSDSIRLNRTQSTQVLAIVIRGTQAFKLVRRPSAQIRLNRTQSTQVLVIVIRGTQAIKLVWRPSAHHSAIRLNRTQSDAIDSGARDRDTRHAGHQARPETESHQLRSESSQGGWGRLIGGTHRATHRQGRPEFGLRRVVWGGGEGSGPSGWRAA